MLKKIAILQSSYGLDNYYYIMNLTAYIIYE